MGSQQMTLQSIGNSRSQLVPEAKSTSWTLAIDGRDNAVIKIKFRAQTVQLVQAYICVLEQESNAPSHSVQSSSTKRYLLDNKQ